MKLLKTICALATRQANKIQQWWKLGQILALKRKYKKTPAVVEIVLTPPTNMILSIKGDGGMTLQEVPANYSKRYSKFKLK